MDIWTLSSAPQDLAQEGLSPRTNYYMIQPHRRFSLQSGSRVSIPCVIFHARIFRNQTDPYSPMIQLSFELGTPCIQVIHTSRWIIHAWTHWSRGHILLFGVRTKKHNIRDLAGWKYIILYLSISYKLLIHNTVTIEMNYNMLKLTDTSVIQECHVI